MFDLSRNYPRLFANKSLTVKFSNEIRRISGSIPMIYKSADRRLTSDTEVGGSLWSALISLDSSYKCNCQSLQMLIRVKNDVSAM